jgi:hypothetical protein
LTVCSIHGISFDFGEVDTDIDVTSIHDDPFKINKKQLTLELGRRTEIIRIIDGKEIPFTRAWTGDKWVDRTKIKSVFIQGKEVKKLIFPENYNETRCAKVSFYEKET